MSDFCHGLLPNFAESCDDPFFRDFWNLSHSSCNGGLKCRKGGVFAIINILMFPGVFGQIEKLGPVGAVFVGWIARLAPHQFVVPAARRKVKRPVLEQTVAAVERFHDDVFAF